MVFVWSAVFLISILYGSFCFARARNLKKAGQKSSLYFSLAAACYIVAFLAWMYVMGVVLLVMGIK